MGDFYFTVSYTSKKKKGISCYSSGVEYRCGRVTQDKNRRHFLFQIKGKEEGRNGTGLLSAILQKILKKINKIKPIQQEKRRIKKSFLSSASCFSCYPASGRIGCCSFAFLCWKCIKQLISRHLNDWCSRKSAAMDLIAIEVDGLLELLAVNGIKSFWFFCWSFPIDVVVVATVVTFTMKWPHVTWIARVFQVLLLFYLWRIALYPHCLFCHFTGICLSIWLKPLPLVFLVPDLENELVFADWMGDGRIGDDCWNIPS